MLQNESVKRWLGGLEPAWTLLDYASFTALRAPPSPAMGPIRLAANLTHDELQQSAVARNALILLLAASSGAGLKLTETGNLSRTVVAELRDRFTWPEFDRRAAFEFNKVINEADFLPLNFVRHLAQAATLLRRHKGHLKISPAGRRLIEAPNIGALQAVLFHVAFWHFDLGILRRGLHHGWLQGHVGIILWCLSLCRRMTGSRPRAMEAQILRPLQWFGLLEHREEKADSGSFARQHFYRKTRMFDRFLSFDVRLEGADTIRH